MESVVQEVHCYSPSPPVGGTPDNNSRLRIYKRSYSTLTTLIILQYIHIKHIREKICSCGKYVVQEMHCYSLSSPIRNNSRLDQDQVILHSLH